MNERYRTYYSSPIGALEITTTDNGIESVDFARDRNQLGTETHPYLDDCTQQLDEYFHDGRKDFTLPLHLVGTEFELRVWNELLRIPFGETRSYKEIAISLGNINSVRAVGAANGNNVIAIIIPCHRVIGADGDLIGYAGELWRKEWLLEHEGVLVQQRLFRE